METLPLWFGRLTVTAFFAIAFGQSAADKLLDSRGNVDFLSSHFANSPLRNLVPAMFWAITALEAAAGMLCGLGALQTLLGAGTSLGLFGLILATLSLLSLFFGQRLAKDYPGAAVLAGYYAVALLGLLLFSFRVTV